MFNYESSFDETDKFRSNDSLYPGHTYNLIYPYFLMTKPKKILEIGTSSGGFAKFLKDNNVGDHIVGVDTSKPFTSDHVPSDKTWEDLFDDFYMGDATKQDFLDWIESKDYKFDLIIEDGDHEIEMQENLIRKCPKLLSDSGVYIIEDIQCSWNVKRLMGCVPREYRPYSYYIDFRYINHTYDDLILVIDLRKL
tara:strand:+ start:1835 stop:2416 length:582 start_codon:yes stop_codon:yes gene_type:complete